MPPKLRQYSPLERQGVNAVEQIVLGYHWIFREQPVSDFGVDAEIEICSDGIPTGRIIKVQIKAGLSWFREKSEGGVVFRDSKEHFDYWLNYSVPVLLTLYDPDTSNVWWAEIERDSVEYTRQGCKIFVPNTQLLSPLSAPILRSIATRDLKGVHVSPPTKLDHETILRMFEEAKTSINVITTYLSAPFRDALCEAARKVYVRIVLSDQDVESIQHLKAAIQQEFLLDLRFSVKDLHSKQVVIDEQIGIYGSSIHGTLSRNIEAVFVVNNLENVQSFVRYFNQIWATSLQR